MSKKEEIVLVVRCAANHVVYRRSCSGCDEDFLTLRIHPFKKLTYQEFLSLTNHKKNNQDGCFGQRTRTVLVKGIFNGLVTPVFKGRYLPNEDSDN